jgi:hypothetical protein
MLGPFILNPLSAMGNPYRPAFVYFNIISTKRISWGLIYWVKGITERAYDWGENLFWWVGWHGWGTHLPPHPSLHQTITGTQRVNQHPTTYQIPYAIQWVRIHHQSIEDVCCHGYNSMCGGDAVCLIYQSIGNFPHTACRLVLQKEGNYMDLCRIINVNLKLFKG